MYIYTKSPSVGSLVSFQLRYSIRAPGVWGSCAVYQLFLVPHSPGKRSQMLFLGFVRTTLRVRGGHRPECSYHQGYHWCFRSLQPSQLIFQPMVCFKLPMFLLCARLQDAGLGMKPSMHIRGVPCLDLCVLYLILWISTYTSRISVHRQAIVVDGMNLVLTFQDLFFFGIWLWPTSLCPLHEFHLPVGYQGNCSVPEHRLCCDPVVQSLQLWSSCLSSISSSYTCLVFNILMSLL